MIKHNQDGAVSGLVLSLVLAVLMLLAAMGFSYWAYSSRQDYKDNSDAKVKAAVTAAVATESAAKDKQFAEASKNPLSTYNGPEAEGSLVIKYPKTWSGYVDDSGKGSAAVDAYFNPGVVPPVGDENATFALHVQVIDQAYADVIQDFTSLQASGSVTISAYSLPKLLDIVGIKVVGSVTDQKTATIIVLPLRSQTIEIETDGTQYLNDFNNYVLPNFSFSP